MPNETVTSRGNWWNVICKGNFSLVNSINSITTTMITNQGLKRTLFGLFIYRTHYVQTFLDSLFLDTNTLLMNLLHLQIAIFNATAWNWEQKLNCWWCFCLQIGLHKKQSEKKECFIMRPLERLRPITIWRLSTIPVNTVVNILIVRKYMMNWVLSLSSFPKVGVTSFLWHKQRTLRFAVRNVCRFPQMLEVAASKKCL